MIKINVHSTILIPILIIILFSCKSEVPNPVAEYFTGAELQYETDDQRDNIIKALNDILALSEEKLKEARYEDYRGNKNKWDLPTLIYRHLVPDKQNKTLGSRFYSDVKRETVQSKVKNILHTIQDTAAQ